MGFFKNLLSGREISRLEELIATSPAPSLFIRLAQLYREKDEEDKANEITRKGAKLFPESDILNDACHDLDKVKNEADKQRIRSRIEQYPSPMLYAKLAELCLSDDLAEAERVCNSGCRSYPDYGGLWTVMARIAQMRGNLSEAYAHLEKATELDKYNYNALFMLAEVAVQTGRKDSAKQALEKILFFAPDDIKAKKWLDNFDAKAAEIESALAAKSPAAKQGADMVESGKQRTAMLNAKEMGLMPEDKKGSGVGTSLHVEIREIRRVEGVSGTILLDPNGLVIASDLPDGMNEELTGALITNIFRIADDHAKNLTLGEFEDGIIDTETGRIHIIRVAQMIMAVFAGTETKAGLLQRAIHTFAERVMDQAG
ncbi:MAG: tetratricopeptide repeat protein [Planctomycetes bacterium]|nr:tetratricopeptide repeat protein [Planctomycetota bacterium]